MIKEFKDESQAKAIAESLGLFMTKYKGIYIIGSNKKEICEEYNMGYHELSGAFYDKDLFIVNPKLNNIHIKDKRIVDASKIEVPYNSFSCFDLFNGCSFLKIPPKIPNSVKDCFRMFLNCPALEISPQIPESVEDCDYMFCNCRSLKQKPQFPPNASAIDALKGTPFESGSVSQKLDS